MSIPHILVVPCPAQGHVMPMMDLAQILAEHGLKVTFVNTESVHNQVVNALPKNDGFESKIHLITIQDGLEPWEDRKDFVKLDAAMQRVVPGNLREIIENFNRAEDDNKITCVIADVTVGWALEVADKLNIRAVAFCPAAAAQLALISSVPKLIEDGIVGNDG